MESGGISTHSSVAIANVVAMHTGLALPTTPRALAGCVLTDDAAFAGVFDDVELGRRCVAFVLGELDGSLEVNSGELARALFGAAFDV